MADPNQTLASQKFDDLFGFGEEMVEEKSMEAFMDPAIMGMQTSAPKTTTANDIFEKLEAEDDDSDEEDPEWDSGERRVFSREQLLGAFGRQSELNMNVFKRDGLIDFVSLFCSGSSPNSEDERYGMVPEGIEPSEKDKPEQALQTFQGYNPSGARGGGFSKPARPYNPDARQNKPW